MRACHSNNKRTFDNRASMRLLRELCAQVIRSTLDTMQSEYKATMRTCCSNNKDNVRIKASMKLL